MNFFRQIAYKIWKQTFFRMYCNSLRPIQKHVNDEISALDVIKKHK